MLSRLTAPAPGRLRAIAAVFAATIGLVALVAVAPAHAATYDPLNIISYDTWRASSSMSTADIQAFLDAQTGPLKSYECTDTFTSPTPARRSAASIIWRSAQAWNLNPKVILATLQKEQSLLTLSNSSNASRIVKAMGYGIYAGSPNRYPGFANQVYNAARGFSTAGGILTWVPGTTKVVEVSATGKKITITPLNACTYRLYTYTPYYPQISFWNHYVNFFEDPLAPPRLKPVYRFRNRSNGSYYYTTSEAKRYTLIKSTSKAWSFGGVAFSVDASAPANSVPLYQMYNTLKHKYYYTTSTSKVSSLLKVRPRQWRNDLVLCNVTTDSSGTAPVYRIQNKSTGAIALTSSLSLRNTLTVGRSAPFRSLAVTFYLDTLETTTTPIGPAN